MKVKYNRYLDSPEWKAKRILVLEYRGEACQKCGAIHNLHIHHGTYTRLYKENLDDLFVFCAGCHNTLHRLIGTKQLLSNTKRFIKGMPLIFPKRKPRVDPKVRRERRRQNFENEFPVAIKAIQDLVPFKKSGVKSIRTWQKAMRHLRKQ